MKQQVFLELCTRILFTTEKWVTFKKELKEVPSTFPPTTVEVLVNGRSHCFDVERVHNMWSEKGSNSPYVISLKSREYPAVFIKLFQEDPDWIEVEEGT